MSAHRLFADLSAAAEDLHGVAVDGQRRDNSLDMMAALMGAARAQTCAIDAVVAAIDNELAKRLA